MKAEALQAIAEAQKAVDRARELAGAACRDHKASDKRKQRVTQMFSDARISLTFAAEFVTKMPDRGGQE
jgi:hypothetical protein